MHYWQQLSNTNEQKKPVIVCIHTFIKIIQIKWTGEYATQMLEAAWTLQFT